MILIPQYRTARRPSASAGILLTDLVAHWDLSEASGTRNDSHTNAYHLTDNNTVGSSTGVDGVSTCALFVSANSEYLSITDKAALRIDDSHFMVNAWVYVTGGANFHGWVCKGNSGLSGGEWSIRGPDSVDTDPFLALCRVRNSANSASVNADAGGLSRNAWIMATLYHNPDANTIAFHLNGALGTSTAITGGVYTGGTNALTLGSIGAGSYMSGRMQSVSIWKGAGAQTALSEIAWLYNSGSAARMYADLQSYGG